MTGLRERLVMVVLGVVGATADGAVAMPVRAVPANLATLEHAVDARFGLHAQHVPLMLMVSGMARVVTGGGVRGMRVVQYEDLPEGLDREALTGLVRQHLGAQWSVMVRDHGGASEETVWVQPAAGERMRMLVVSVDGDELDLVEMELNAEQLGRWTREHRQ